MKVKTGSDLPVPDWAKSPALVPLKKTARPEPLKALPWPPKGK